MESKSIRRSVSKVAEQGDKQAKCLTCENKPHSRGLCQRCLAAARAAIDRGEITEASLIRRKLMLPAKRVGRIAESGFSKALAKIKGK